MMMMAGQQQQINVDSIQIQNKQPQSAVGRQLSPIRR